MAKLVPFGRRSLIDELFGDVNPGFFIRPLHGDALPSQIKVEVKEDKDSYTVLAELPGLKKEDIHVSVDNKILTISAEIQQEDKKTEDEKVIHSERYYGQVSRSIELQTEIELSRAQAKYDQGILSMQLPKKTGSSTQRLAVS
jgi:HSP20 family protein